MRRPSPDDLIADLLVILVVTSLHLGASTKGAGELSEEDTTKPPAASLRAQQSRFDNFRHVFSNERPHEGLNNQVPASLYIPSAIRLPRKLPEFRYPKGLQLRRVNNSGDISWHKNRIFISEVFRFEEFGVELITPGLYRVFFRNMEIGELNSEELRFRAARRVL
jgi:hypothetical protein